MPPQGRKASIDTRRRGPGNEGQEPIAIVGIGCRFPGGADNAGAFWELLCGGVDAITEIPDDRWDIDSFYQPEPAGPGRTNSKWGGFIEGIPLFDHGFFRISPREAALMDPQQRLLLEVAWETFEEAGQSMETLAGSRTGVFIGASNLDYLALQQSASGLGHLDKHSGTGSALSILANRISFAFDLRGPSLAIDTACSSSLNAVHLACRSLWNRESTLALAGGVNLLITPGTFVGFSRLSMLSADGRCKAFSSDANGYVRSEGAGLVLLKPISQACREGDRIYGLIRGTGINQDGQTSSLTVPSQQAQELLLREICDSAGLRPDQIDYAEAHGTGTPIGDPIEALALGRVFGGQRSGRGPLLIGSVKTNIGHLEPASGIAGLIKAVLCLKHRFLPANLHFREPNPEIPWDELNLRVVEEPQTWSSEALTRRSVVCSFGFGGANAAVLLEEFEAAPGGSGSHPTEGEKATARVAGTLLVLSARTEPALRSLAAACREQIDQSRSEPEFLKDLCWSAACRRSHFEHRFAAAADDLTGLSSALEEFSGGHPNEGVTFGRVPAGVRARPWFVFCGQGAQRWDMGHGLLESNSVFRDSVRKTARLFQEVAGWSLEEEWLRVETASRLNETCVAQPVLFAFQVALAQLWISWGVEPGGVLGHSVGEVAAAHIAGALSLEDAVQVIYNRSHWMELAGARGGMLAVGLTREQAQALIGETEAEIELAAINNPGMLTLSGTIQDLQKVEETLRAQGVFHRRLQVDYAFHSRLMEPVEETLRSSLQSITSRSLNCEMISTVTGLVVDSGELDSEYWWRNIRQTVRFGPAVQLALQMGAMGFLEIAPHPILKASLLECAGTAGKTVTAIGSLERDLPDELALCRNLGRLYVEGFAVRWEGVFGKRARYIPLPAYQWQREEHWSEPAVSREMRLERSAHPILGRRKREAQPTWVNAILPTQPAILQDHRIHDKLILPGAATVTAALAAGGELFGAHQFSIDHLQIRSPCILQEEEATRFQSIFDREASSLKIFTVKEGSDDWALHCRCDLRPINSAQCQPDIDLEAALRRCHRRIGARELYTGFFERGLDYGPSFSCVVDLQFSASESIGHLKAPKPLGEGFTSGVIHPALLDACFQTVFCHLVPRIGETDVYVPVSIRRIRTWDRAGEQLYSRLEVVKDDPSVIETNLCICNNEGAVLAEMLGLCFQRVELGELNRHNRLFLRTRWESIDRDETVRVPLIDRLTAAGIQQRLQESFQRFEQELNLTGRCQAFEKDSRPFFSEVVFDGLARCGIESNGNALIQVNELEDRLPVHRLTGVLELLSDVGLLEAAGGDFKVLAQRASIDVEQEYRRLLRTHPQFCNELFLFYTLAPRLVSLLADDVGTAPLLSSLNLVSMLEDAFESGYPWRAQDFLLTRFVHDFLRVRRLDRPVRLLFLNPSSASWISGWAETLPRGGFECVVTHASQATLDRLKDHLGDDPRIVFTPLDLRSNLSDKLTESGPFDLVVSPESVLEGEHPAETLRKIQQLLAAGGDLLILGAPTVPSIIRCLSLFVDRDRGVTQRREPGEGNLPGKTLDRLLPVSGVLVAEVFNPEGTRDPMLRWIQFLPMVHEGTQPVLTPPSSRSWLLLGDRSGYVEALASSLESLGQNPVVLDRSWNAESVRKQGNGPLTDELRAFVTEAGVAFEGVVDLRALDLEPTNSGAELHLEEIESEILSLAQSAGALNELGPAQKRPRLYQITRNAQDINSTGQLVDPKQTAFWGIGRVITAEMPSLEAVRIDISDCDREQEIRTLTGLLVQGDCDDEMAVRGRQSFTLRYVSGLSQEPESRDLIHQEEFDNWCLVATNRGSIDGLTFESDERAAPGPGQVEIDVSTVGLNFADLMKALRIYPGGIDETIRIGGECTGRIVRVGEGVEGLKVGQAVVALANGSVAFFVTTRAEAVTVVPELLSAEDFATVPIAFLTAHYAMNHLAKVKKGERVLIHLASGGVGLAAVQLAKLAGAKVLATAGSRRKRDFLRSLGILHVFNSRSFECGDEIRRLTNGEGVDVILNALAGQAIVEGLAILAKYGRFIEIGKRDIYGNTRIGLGPFQKQISVQSLDLDALIREQPDKVRMLLQEVELLFRKGKLTPLPSRTFPVTQAKTAFRYFSRAQQIGKVLLSMKCQVPPVVRRHRKLQGIRQHGTYLVTGGMGGFGIRVADWLALKGAGSIALVGRRPPAESVLRRIDRLETTGVEVRCFQADVGSLEGLGSVLEEVRDSMPPLCGVFHAAAVFNDAIVRNLDRSDLHEVCNPKIAGAWNLHKLTETANLDHFVLFSSAASAFGNPGQAAYSAANAFLDGLAGYRQGLGLPAVSVQWGLIEGEGFAARNIDVSRRLKAAGVNLLRPEQALVGLELILKNGAPTMAMFDVDWKKWSRLWGSRPPARVQQLLSATSAEPRSQGAGRLREALLAASGVERFQLAAGLLTDRLARILGTGADRVDPDVSIIDLGLDSLMGIELRNWVETEFGLDLASVEYLKGPTLNELCSLLLEKLGSQEAAASVHYGGRKVEESREGTDVTEE